MNSATRAPARRITLTPLRADGRPERTRVATSFGDGENIMMELAAMMPAELRMQKVAFEVLFENGLTFCSVYELDSNGLDKKERLLREAVSDALLVGSGRRRPAGMPPAMYADVLKELGEKVTMCRRILDECARETVWG